MKSHKSIVEPILLEICELVRLEDFASVVEELVCVKYAQTHGDKDVCENVNAYKSLPERGSSLPTFKVGLFSHVANLINVNEEK